jgi:hypothetical protein
MRHDIFEKQLALDAWDPACTPTQKPYSRPSNSTNKSFKLCGIHQGQDKTRKRISAMDLVNGVQGAAFERLDFVDEILFQGTDRDIFGCISIRVAHCEFDTKILRL